MVPLLQLPQAGPSTLERSINTHEIDPRSREILTHLRMVALQCRAAARTDLFEACALLSLDGENAKRTFADTLTKCLGTALNRPITWYRPGVYELSFDEAWLMRCFEMVNSQDPSNLKFLLRSRVAPQDQRYIGFLIAQISDKFCLI